MTDKSKPLYMIGVVADMLKLHPQTLRMYEKKGLIRPSRTEGQTRRYSAEDVEEISRVTGLARDLGVNLTASRSSKDEAPDARHAGSDRGSHELRADGDGRDVRSGRRAVEAKRWCGPPEPPDPYDMAF